MTTLSPDLRQLLTVGLGLAHAGPAVPALSELSPPRSRLRDHPHVAEQLRGLLGDEHLLLDDESRIRHTRGRSTPDLLRLRYGDLAEAPDAVARPDSHEQVQQLLELCATRRVAVVPFGGGTSVVGGLSAAANGFTAVLAVDLHRMSRLLELDEFSRTATLEPGLRGPEVEALLSERGYTLGHFPQSFEYATVGGFAATRSSGQASAGYHRFDELVVAIRMATPRGTLELGHAPRSAAGPDLRQLLLGSEGCFGVITAVTVEIVPAPQTKLYEGWRLASFQQGTDLVRRLAQDGPLPTVLRLSDEVETALDAAQRPSEPDARAAPREQNGTSDRRPRHEPGGTGDQPPPREPGDTDDQPAGGCALIVGYEGSEPELAARRTAVTDLLLAHGATPIPGAGDAWADARFRAPYLRDALLDAGALVETLETATFWSRLPQLYEAVRSTLIDALQQQGTPPVVLCHISHVYRSGASLYFTVACAQADDPLRQWATAKAAASDAIVAAGGTITHHHGVGRDHRPWFERQLGDPATHVLRAVKRALDPEGVMNPGALVT